MTKNHIAQSAFTPEAAANEHASSINPGLAAPAACEGDFASPVEEDAYWAGVADGMRNAGGTPPRRLAARARDNYPELVATEAEITGRPPADPLDFDPVSLRHRIDGWTPQKQREYIEALADSGVARYAAARVGMSEQSASRLCRRDDARSFNRACEAALRFGARRLVSVAFERAIEGTIKRHHYHGEVTSEERVYDNRLLIALIGKLDRMLPEESREIAENWQPWMEAIEQGAPPPRAEAEPPAEEDAEKNAEQYCGDEIWEAEGRWWTEFPPPPGFAGDEKGAPGDCGYCRTLSDAEQAVIDADIAADREKDFVEETARRDRYFGFVPEEPAARTPAGLDNSGDVDRPPEQPLEQPDEGATFFAQGV